MKKPTVFVIMPFTDDFFESYEMLKEHFSDRFEFLHAGDEDNQQNILADIIMPIYNADVILADLSGLNPNVMYELGIAHSLNKKTIVITRDDLETLPFDLKQYRAKDYSTHFKKFNELVSYLEKHLTGAVDGSVVFSNPVSDFLDKNQLQPESLFKENAYSVLIPDGEKGFIDFLADIEDSTRKMAVEINTMNEEMEIMSQEIKSATSEMERVQKNSGSSTASFIRKQTKKVAHAISTFSGQLNAHNEEIQSKWNEIEKNTLGLLENDFSAKPENKESLTNYIKSLCNMKETIIKSNESVESMKEASLNNIGMERSLNQSIRFLDQDLETYLSMTNQMISDIDRIVRKSRLIIGIIE